MRGLAQVYIEDGSSSSDSKTISDPRAVKKRKLKDLDHNHKVKNIVLNATLQRKRKSITIVLINSNFFKNFFERILGI